MSKIHDIGAQPGFGPVDPTEIQEPFAHEWEARVFSMNRLLLKAGIYTLDEFRYAVERLSHDEYFEASYYERWLLGIERLLQEKGIIEP
jgi:nitrile hydratase